MGGGVNTLLHSVRQLIASRHTLDHYILFFDPCFRERLGRALEQRINNLAVPPRVHNTDSQSRPCTEGVSE